MNWIAVNERLPQTNKLTKVVGLVNAQIPYVLDFLPQGRFVLHILYPQEITEDITAVVTHWLPLPQFPKQPIYQSQNKETEMETIADSILPRYVPDDPGANTCSFELSVHGQRYLVNYHKDPDGYWKFAGSERQS